MKEKRLAVEGRLIDQKMSLLRGLGCPNDQLVIRANVAATQRQVQRMVDAGTVEA